MKIFFILSIYIVHIQGFLFPLYKIANEARGLASDAIKKAKSGHLGLPLGASEIGSVLWGNHLQHNPKDPYWINRDRFVLSAGHGSIFLYTWLHLSGYEYMTMEQLQQFRQANSYTPGHPENHFPGIECTTGPLGQGFANGVGLAVAQKSAVANFNTPKYKIFDNHIIVLCGDGCIQEGISSEASSFAAHEGLDNLIVLYDSNNVTLDKMADFTQSENITARYLAYGWDVITVDGHNITELNNAIYSAKLNDNHKPKLVICNTIIGKGIQEIEGTNNAHGEGGVKYLANARKVWDLPDENWFVSDQTKTFFENRYKFILKPFYENWQTLFKQWKKEYPEKAKLLESYTLDSKTIYDTIPIFKKNMATRDAGSIIIQFIAKLLPLYLSGSADLHSSTKNYIKDVGDFGCGNGKNYLGRNIFYGIREQAMGAIMNGISNFGIHQVSGSTFLVFSDYMRSTIRVAALSNLSVGYIFTHDSIFVGEDGPTHQPVETVSSLRLIPNLDVIRPADSEETVGAFVSSVIRQDGPTALILSRQSVPILPIESHVKRDGVLNGAYIAKKETGNLSCILIACGSELQYAFEAVEELKDDTIRIISAPCLEIFERQSQEYKDMIFPPTIKKRIAIESGVTGLWYKYVGLDGKVLGIDQFGFSAPGEVIRKKLGITKENIISLILE